MAGNSFGVLFSLTTFGESHGTAIGGVVDGMPSGIPVPCSFIEDKMKKRRPGQSAVTTERNEADEVEFLSGIFEGKSTGAPIAFLIRNTNARSSDYQKLKNLFRPSHGDFTWEKKFGNRDYRGGGRYSARETAVRVVAGALAQLYIESEGIWILPYVSAVGDVKMPSPKTAFTESMVWNSVVRCPDKEVSSRMEKLIIQKKDDGDSIGSEVSCLIKNCPIGLGEPVFDKLQADLAKAVMSINGAKAFELGDGFEFSSMSGSEANDMIIPGRAKSKVEFLSNHSGGIQAGISNGDNIFFRVAFRPPASISKTQKTVNTSGIAQEISIEGRHDPCIGPRAVPVVEAMTALVLADHLMRFKAIKMSKA